MKSPVDTKRLGVTNRGYCEPANRADYDRDATGGITQRSHALSPMDPGHPMFTDSKVPTEKSGPSMEEGLSLRETIRPSSLR